MKKDNKNISIYMLYKFGKEEYMRALFDEGLIYFNTIKFFQNYESDDGRQDINEALLLKMENASLWIDDKIIAEKVDSKLFSYLSQNFSTITHIYSLTGFFNGHQTYNENKLFNDKLFELGEYFVQINKPKIFIDRITEYLKPLIANNNPKYYTAGKVFYSDSSCLNPLNNLFHKNSKYEYQSEFRLLLACQQNTEPFYIKIGSINDIAEIHPTKDFLNYYLLKNNNVHLSKIPYE